MFLEKENNEKARRNLPLICLCEDIEMFPLSNEKMAKPKKKNSLTSEEAK